jgi:hypothetical protein
MSGSESEYSGSESEEEAPRRGGKQGGGKQGGGKQGAKAQEEAETTGDEGQKKDARRRK